MPLYESPAVALRSIRLGDADKLVTFFTLNHGKMKAVAKGAAKPKSKFGGRLEPFNVVNMIAFGSEKSDLLRLNTADIMERLPGLGANLDKMSRAWVCAELVDHLQKDRDPNREGFRLLVSAWRLLAVEESPIRQNLLLRIFELKYLSAAGFKPVLDRCATCGGELSGHAGAGFNPRKGGAVCGRCVKTDPLARRISTGAVMMMRKGLSLPLEKALRLWAGPEPLEEIEKAVADFIGAHVRREMRAERFLHLP